MQRLLAAASPRYRIPIACALFSGLRLSELLGLTWRDIDSDRSVLGVRHQLSREGKRVSLKTPPARRDVILIPDQSAAARRKRKRRSTLAASVALNQAASRCRECLVGET